MLFITSTIKTEDLNEVNNFFNDFDAPNFVEDDEDIETPVSQYLTSLVSSQYQKAVEDIENTKIGNNVKRKRSLQQVMRESFFYGSNRFGNNFIA